MMDKDIETMVFEYLDNDWFGGRRQEIQLGNGDVCISRLLKDDETLCLGFSKMKTAMKIGSRPKKQGISNYNVIISILNLEAALVLKKVVDGIVDKLEQDL